MALDCVSIGDGILDVYLDLTEGELRYDSEEKAHLCLRWGEKIPVNRMDQSIGGNAVNNAIGLSRLGFQTALISVHGRDKIGELIEESLKKEKIDRSMVVESDEASRYAAIINFRGERTILEFNKEHRYVLPHDFPETKWVYVSSVGNYYEEFFAALANLVSERKIKLAFTPNNAQLTAKIESYEPLLAACEVLLVNKEEAAKMIRRKEVENREAVKRVMREIGDLGPKMVVVTDGAEGSYGFDGNNFYFMGVADFPVVSATGAGDAYASGFMGALLQGKEMREAMAWGTVNAGSVISEWGAHKGLLSQKQIENLLKKKNVKSEILV